MKRCIDGLVKREEDIESLKTFSACERMRMSEVGERKLDARRSQLPPNEEREPKAPPTARGCTHGSMSEGRQREAEGGIRDRLRSRAASRTGGIVVLLPNLALRVP